MEGKAKSVTKYEIIYCKGTLRPSQRIRSVKPSHVEISIFFQFSRKKHFSLLRSKFHAKEKLTIIKYEIEMNLSILHTDLLQTRGGSYYMAENAVKLQPPGSRNDHATIAL